ncbi:winged helix-turn-helix domain-containing protein [Granulicella sp. S156]|uniref:winged helix-turn-helix domain-containing protein n=1 Tax=Granulicella sp. S156 TaxID=1747224 RepID=UPI00131D1182|nr:winged helix-turn-helix domain-containing protein [Granulicella sp. S156]
MQTPVANSRLTFGLYEVDLQAGELWKAGFRIKLQGQPFKVLTALIERPGQVVSREELQLRLWGKDTVVDFDHSLGTAINKIREALGDSAENPRFIETLARRGYRFIAPVGYLPAEGVPAQQSATDPARSASEWNTTLPAGDVSPLNDATLATAGVQSKPDSTSSGITQRVQTSVARPYRWAIATIGLVSMAAVGYFVGSSRSTTAPPHITQITHDGHLAPSVNTIENHMASATDGVRLFAPTLENGHAGLAVVSLSGGSVAPMSIPSEVASPALGDISPDGSRLLLRDHLSPESEQPLWVVPTIGGSPLRVGNTLAHDATWMPDGKEILYANGNDLYLTGNKPELYASLPGRAFWLRWEPNGKLLRFSMIDPIAHTLSLWQLSASDRKPVPVLAGFTNPSSECCGIWTNSGRSFVFQSSHGGNTDLWKLSGESTKNPVRLTDGPLEFQSPVAAPNSSRVFFLGVDARSELERVTPNGELVPEKGFLSSAFRIDYTRDGKWVAWTDSGGQLWRASADGTEKLQLTPDTLDVFLAQWSPDGSRLALMAREPGKAWQIYRVGANGNDLTPLLKESRNAADPSWSPDGLSLVFGRINDAMGKENAARTLHILHLPTNQVEQVPASDGLFSPRWSPDGRYIAALTLDQRQVRLYDVANHTWKALSVPSGADPVWSSDSRSLYVHGSLDPAQPIYRVSIPEGHVQEVVRLADSRENDAVDYVFGGLTQDNTPLIRARIFAGNFYSLDVK